MFYLEGAICVSFVLSVQIVSDLYEIFCSLFIHGKEALPLSLLPLNSICCRGYWCKEVYIPSWICLHDVMLN